MRSFNSCLSLGAALALCAGSAFAGTTEIDFTQGIGNLVRIGSSGSLTTDDDCKAVLGNTSTYVVGNGGSPVSSGGVTSITIGITPAQDLTISQELAIVLIEASSGEVVTASVDQNGDVVLTNGFASDDAFFVAPAAPNAAFTLSYNQTTDVATVTIAGASNNAVLNGAFPLGDGGPVQIGVLAISGAKFRSLSATGAGIPDLDSTGECAAVEGEGEGTGIEGELEGEGEAPSSILAVGGSYLEVGERLELSLIGAEGAVGYQWTKNGVDLSGELNPTLVRDPVSEPDEGVYRCEVDLGSKAIVVSEPVIVTVFPINGVPAAGGIGLALMAAAVAAFGFRRRK